jgi:flagellar biosynthesis chaperone FliJ
MRSMTTLIRLAQAEVDEQRVDLGRIVQARSEAASALTTHDAQVARETAIPRIDAGDFATFSAWMARAARARARLHERFMELDRAEAAAKAALTNAIAQMKRLQIVFETAQATLRQIRVNRNEMRADEREVARHTAARAALHEAA